MHELYELKEKLVKELEDYSRQEMTAGSLEVIDRLAHAVKNICKIIESYEMEGDYSQRGGGQGGRYSYDNGNQGGRYSRNGGYYSRDGGGAGSYARGRGQGARRDSMGRYSRGGDPEEMANQLDDMMQDAPNDQIRQQIQQLANQIRQM